MAFGVNDSSGNQHQSTVGVAFSDTSHAKFGNASLNTTAGGSYAQFPFSSDWQFGAGQFTVECWVYFTSHNASNYEAVIDFWSGSGNYSWWLGMSNTGQLAFLYTTDGSTSNTIGAAYTPTLNTWISIAVDRDASNVVRVYANGVVVASATMSSTIAAAGSATLTMGLGGDGASKFYGYIDEVRVSKGTARYGGAYTPASSAFTTDANTNLLVHFDAGALGTINTNKMRSDPALQQTIMPGGAVLFGKAPSTNKHTVSGVVKVLGVAASGIIVCAHAKVTKELLGIATTAGDGSYSINCGVNFTDVYVIAFDPTTYQALVFDQVVPG